MKTVHYCGWYIAESDTDEYVGNIPGMLKMRYVTRKIQEAGFPVKVYSFANKKRGLFYAPKTSLQNDVKIRYAGGFHVTGRLSKTINNIIKYISFVLYFCFSVKKTDTVILYHSVSYSSILTHINRIIKKNVILEVEEIYGYSAVGDDEKSLRSESNSIQNNNKFILINDYIARKYDIPQDSYVPCFGVADGLKRTAPRMDDGKIHVVYAGTIEGRKQGAYIAVEAAEYLPENYILHVLGFGKDENIRILKDRIKEINTKRGFDIVEYLGYKSGKDLDDFLFSCHIGVSTYVMRPDFANCSLPSKIFTYMSHDLAVVRGFASAYDGEEIAKYWCFYYDEKPEEIANAIVNAKIPEIGVTLDFLKKCDARVVKFLKNNC